MQEQTTASLYGVFVCETCRDEPSKDCSDYCGVEYADELPPLWADLIPCKCCGADVHLVAPLAPLDI
jgi:hypothetical protein